MLISQILDHVLGCLRDHRTELIKALAAGAARDLLEIAHRQQSGFFAIVLAQLREQHGADRDIHAHPQRIGAANELEQPFLRKSFDQYPVARQ